MRLVPRQLRKSSFPSSVPYYGGRLTPQVIAGLAPPPPPPPVALSAEQTEQLAALARLRDRGVLTEAEYETMCRRVTERS